MTGIARVLPPFQLGFDCLDPLTEATAAAFYASGYRFVGRYLESLSIAERDAIFNAKLAIAPITYARTTPLNGTLGQQVGAQSVRRAVSWGIPPSVHVTIDNEATHGEVADVIAYLNGFAGALTSGGYGAMLYVGRPESLTAQELFALRPNRYWRSISMVPEPACGWCMMQLTPGDQVIHGHQVDVDVSQADYFGRLPVLWYPA